jgi:hypothetical protein
MVPRDIGYEASRVGIRVKLQSKAGGDHIEFVLNVLE